MTSSKSQSDSQDDRSATSLRVVEHVVEQHAEEAAFQAAAVNPKSGHPHGTMMREVLPWCDVEYAILLGPDPTSLAVAEGEALVAFDRLCEKRGEFRRLRPWLRFAA